MNSVDNEALIDRLLYEAESDELDFKEEQYRFITASDKEKSKLLKDLLAFANAWRRADAYILVGVKEVKGGRSIEVGISQDIDDAQIQQFVNSKTQRPLIFSYRVALFNQKRIGIFHIPTQRRPLFLKKDFGGLKEKTVYLRRGTSTAIADPDEIAIMGATAEPQSIKNMRPWVAIDNYEQGTSEDETGQEFSWESIRIVNRGDAPAVSIGIHWAPLRHVSLFNNLRTLGPGEANDVQISGLHASLKRAYCKMQTPSESGKTLLVPVVVEYRGLNHSTWTTEHAISFDGLKTNIELVHEQQSWTDLSFPE